VVIPKHLPPSCFTFQLISLIGCAVVQKLDTARSLCAAVLPKKMPTGSIPGWSILTSTGIVDANSTAVAKPDNILGSKSVFKVAERVLNRENCTDNIQEIRML
jgi:hypothetical protein